MTPNYKPTNIPFPANSPKYKKAYAKLYVERAKSDPQFIVARRLSERITQKKKQIRDLLDRITEYDKTIVLLSNELENIRTIWRNSKDESL